MSTQTYVIYDKYNGHIVCDIKDNYLSLIHISEPTRP